MLGFAHRECSVNCAYSKRRCWSLELRMTSCPQLCPSISGQTMIKCFWRKLSGQQQPQTIAQTRKSDTSSGLRNIKILFQESCREKHFQDRMVCWWPKVLPTFSADRISPEMNSLVQDNRRERVVKAIKYITQIHHPSSNKRGWFIHVFKSETKDVRE